MRMKQRPEPVSRTFSGKQARNLFELPALRKRYSTAGRSQKAFHASRVKEGWTPWNKAGGLVYAQAARGANHFIVFEPVEDWVRKTRIGRILKWPGDYQNNPPQYGHGFKSCRARHFLAKRACTFVRAFCFKDKGGRMKNDFDTT